MVKIFLKLIIKLINNINLNHIKNIIKNFMILNMISEKNGIFEFTLNLREILNCKVYINNIKIN